jgi:hypothetical protein
MIEKKGEKILTIVSLSILFAFTVFIASFSFAWETKDPQLAKDWEKMLGFKAADKVGKVAPEINPGMVIDSSNYKNYPGLKDLLPGGLYTRLDPNSYAPLAPIKMVKTDQYHLSPGCLKATLKNIETCRLDKDGITLLGFNGGIPFIHPKNGNELIQWVDYFYAGDSLAFRPMRMRLYGRNNTPEREIRQEVNNLVFYGCTDWKKEAPNPQGIHHVASGVFTYPKDINGAAYVRKRFIDGNKPDEFLLFIPSMRRIRKMSGRDTQDPLFGSDLVWDDFKTYWQKMSPVEFPNEYKMLPQQEMLVPTAVDYNFPYDRDTAGYKDYTVDESGQQVFLKFGSWQKRPVYPVEIISKDLSYLYGKRVLYNDLEVAGQWYTDMYDAKGRLWRSALMTSNFSGKGEGMAWDFDDIVDVINRHRTILDFKCQRNPTWMIDGYADLRFLSKKVK